VLLLNENLQIVIYDNNLYCEQRLFSAT